MSGSLFLYIRKKLITPDWEGQRNSTTRKNQWIQSAPSTKLNINFFHDCLDICWKINDYKRVLSPEMVLSYDLVSIYESLWIEEPFFVIRLLQLHSCLMSLLMFSVVFFKCRSSFDNDGMTAVQFFSGKKKFSMRPRINFVSNRGPKIRIGSISSWSTFIHFHHATGTPNSCIDSLHRLML